jgi:hypothetical protein
MPSKQKILYESVGNKNNILGNKQEMYTTHGWKIIKF